MDHLLFDMRPIVEKNGRTPDLHGRTQRYINFTPKQENYDTNIGVHHTKFLESYTSARHGVPHLEHHGRN